VLPPPAIEYIVADELVHLREPRHAPEFSRLLSRVIADPAERSLWLTEHAGLSA